MSRTVALIAALFMGAGASAATLAEDVARYVAIFDGNPAAHNDAVESLAWQGISDTRLFDGLATRIETERRAALDDSAHKGRVARYIRALGFSGQSKYRPLLATLSLDKKYDRYARQALADLGQYNAWNPIISDRATFEAGLDDETNRVLNMLRAEDLELKRIGAKRVYFGTRSEHVLDVLAAEVTRLHGLSAKLPDESIDSVAWLVKALAATDQVRFRTLLVEVNNGSAHKKVKKWARSGIERLDEKR